MNDRLRRHLARAIRLVLGGLFIVPACAQATLFNDPLDTLNALPAPTEQQISQAGLPPCTSGDIHEPLSLADAISRALCFNPQTREAWSAIEAQAAAVGTARSAYLPTVTAQASVSRVNEDVNYHNTPEFDASLHGSSNQQAVALNWVLYDFGLRAANLRRERALLSAATAGRDEAVRSVFVAAAHAYFAALQAQATLAAETETEQLSRKSVDVVKAKADAGVGSEADRLQAATAHAQAHLNRIRANEALQKALGALAVIMGTRPGTPLILQQQDAQADEVPEVTAIADHLIDHALQTHPQIALARAQQDAAQAAVVATQRAGQPSIALMAIGDRSDNPINRVSTEQTIESSSIGLQLTIPLFDGFARTYRIRQAQAELAGRKAALFAAQQQVAQSVWESYVEVRASAEQLQASDVLLDNARQSFAMAMGRYQASVGNVIELLKAQSDLAAARKSTAQARTQWRFSRLQLASSLGEIDLSSSHIVASATAPSAATVAPPFPRAPIALPQRPADIGPPQAPLIASIAPKPVPGSKGPQALTISGEHFIDGATVNLRDRTRGLEYPHRQPIIVETTSIWVWADIGCASQWTAEVVNPDGRSSGPFSFHVTGPCTKPAARPHF